jgi:hypothetical protein
VAPVLLFCVLATISSLSAVVVVAAARFNKPAACLLALLAGLGPWGVIAVDLGWIPSLWKWTIILMLGSGPLFMASFLHFGIGKKPPRWRIVAIASIVGACSGIGFVVLLYCLIMRM